MISISLANNDFISITSQGILLLASIISATAYIFAAFILKYPVDREGNSIPKGPIGLPIIGAFRSSHRHDKYTPALDIGSFPFLTRYPELTLDYWARKFGPLYAMRLGNQLFVIVSDPLIAKDLMISNGATFSSRKQMFIKSQTIFAGRGITVMPYNAQW
jgi:Cytochrome P450